MTSKLTRERLEKIKSWRETYGAGSNVMLPAEEAEELASIALAAMDSEPVAWTWQHLKQWHVTNDEARARDLAWDGVKVEPLYRHAQPVPVVPEEKSIPNTLSMYAVDAVAAIAEVKGWNACRAAMLQELKKSAGTEAICRSDENVQVLHTKSPAQSDCCPAQNHVSPEQNGDTPAQSQGWIQVSEQMPPSRHEVLVGRWWGEKPRWCCKWATYIPGHPDAQSSGWLIPGASWTPTHWMPLPAAPQEVKSES
ncbi:DUF551 domain-containing protein [Klebsiella pneumoniae]